MKYINKIIGILIVFISGLLLLALFLPDKQSSFCTIRVDASSARVYKCISDVNQWKQWRPFESGSEHLDKLSIINVINGQQVDAQVLIDNHKQLKSTWKLKPEEGLVRITWEVEIQDLSYPSGRLMGLFFEPVIKPMQKQALTKLEKVLLLK